MDHTPWDGDESMYRLPDRIEELKIDIKSLRSELASLKAQRGLEWQTGKPPKEGWYWIYDPSCPFVANWKGSAFQFGYSYGVLADKWSGPIPLPGEKEGK